MIATKIIRITLAAAWLLTLFAGAAVALGFYRFTSDFGHALIVCACTLLCATFLASFCALVVGLVLRKKKPELISRTWIVAAVAHVTLGAVLFCALLLAFVQWSVGL